MLAGHFARPVGSSRVPGLVICHSFPMDSGSPGAGSTFPYLADRIAADAGWAALAFNYRGAGSSPGNFSVHGWRDDLACAIDWIDARSDIAGVWLLGANIGGAFAICQAASDQRVRGVATFGTPSDLSYWSGDAETLLKIARHGRYIKDDDFPGDVKKWSSEIAYLDPLGCVSKLGERELLVMHGSADDTVSVADARALAEAAPVSEFRLIYAGAHRLRHDPRAVAMLIGWLDRRLP